MSSLVHDSSTIAAYRQRKPRQQDGADDEVAPISNAGRGGAAGPSGALQPYSAGVNALVQYGGRYGQQQADSGANMPRMNYNMETVRMLDAIGPAERRPLVYTGDVDQSLAGLRSDVLASYRSLCSALGEQERHDLTALATSPAHSVLPMFGRGGMGAGAAAGGGLLAGAAYAPPLLLADLPYHSSPFSHLPMRSLSAGAVAGGGYGGGNFLRRLQPGAVAAGANYSSSPLYNAAAAAAAPHGGAPSPMHARAAGLRRSGAAPAAAAGGDAGGVRWSQLALVNESQQGPLGSDVRSSRGHDDPEMQLAHQEATLVYPPAGSTFSGALPSHALPQSGPQLDTLQDFKYRKLRAIGIGDQEFMAQPRRSEWALQQVPGSNVPELTPLDNLPADQIDHFLQDFAATKSTPGNGIGAGVRGPAARVAPSYINGGFGGNRRYVGGVPASLVAELQPPRWREAEASLLPPRSANTFLAAFARS